MILGHDTTRNGLTLQLRGPGIDWSGRVTDRAGLPVSGAKVYFGSSARRRATDGPPDMTRTADGELIALTREPILTDASGSFTCEGFVRDRITIQVRADGFADRVLTIPPEDAERAPVEIVLDPECVLEGTIRDAAGVPVAHADVMLRFFSAQGLAPAKTTADAEGRFRFGRLAPGS